MVILLLLLELACSIPIGLLGPVCRIMCSDQCAELLAQSHARNQWQQEEKSPDVLNISLGSVTGLSFPRTTSFFLQYTDKVLEKLHNS